MPSLTHRPVPRGCQADELVRPRHHVPNCCRHLTEEPRLFLGKLCLWLASASVVASLEHENGKRKTMLHNKGSSISCLLHALLFNLDYEKVGFFCLLVHEGCGTVLGTYGN